eukprot:881634-Prymnesium_polylepis.1
MATRGQAPAKRPRVPSLQVQGQLPRKVPMTDLSCDLQALATQPWPSTPSSSSSPRRRKYLWRARPARHTPPCCAVRSASCQHHRRPGSSRCFAGSR